MKHALFWFMLAVSLGGRMVPALADDETDRAAAIAARQESEANYRRLSASVEDLLTAQNVLQKRLAALSEEIRQTREDAGRSNTNYVTRDELKRFYEDLKEIDRKRQEDKELILKEIRKLAQAPVAVPVDPPKSTPPPDKTDTSSKEPDKKTYEGTEHVVKQGEVLSIIAREYNKYYSDQGKETSTKLILKANPDLDERKIRVGQKIFIPLVPK